MKKSPICRVTCWLAFNSDGSTSCLFDRHFKPHKWRQAVSRWPPHCEKQPNERSRFSWSLFVKYGNEATSASSVYAARRRQTRPGHETNGLLLTRQQTDVQKSYLSCIKTFLFVVDDCRSLLADRLPRFNSSSSPLNCT